MGGAATEKLSIRQPWQGRDYFLERLRRGI